MEEKLQFLLDNLDISQTRELLDHFDNHDKISASLNRKTLQRIKSKAYFKAGLKKPWIFSVPRKLAAFAAVLAIVTVPLIFTNFGSIAVAFNRLFSVIPGVGIVENNEEIEYTLAKQQSAEMNGSVLTVTNAFASKSSVTVYFVVEKIRCTEDQLILDKQKASENIQNSKSSDNQGIYLDIDGKRYPSSIWSMGGGLKDYYSVCFDIKGAKIAQTSKCVIGCTNCGISCDFSFIPIRSVDTLEQIGPTQEHNKLWLTATSTEKDGSYRWSFTLSIKQDTHWLVLKITVVPI